jgi:hypothetical protein
MGAVDPRIDVHQIGGGDFSTAPSAELCRARWLESVIARWC